ncbi:MAG: pyrroloquinoline quinone biosynthesis peptide chaperone PqqD [Rhodospirillales bacterium]
MTGPPAAADRPADRLGERPRLATGVRLSHDERRQRWVLQAPERLFVLDEIAYEVIRRCDGREVAALVDELALSFDADRDQIAADVLALLDDLRAKGVLAG